MTALSRRRFLTISASAVSAAALAAHPALAAASPMPVSTWRSTALGSAARITLTHSQADSLFAGIEAELNRLENIFSLYRSGSALSRLNRDGILRDPAPELLECLTIAGAVWRATDGAFDPTVQPLWAAYAQASVEGRTPDADELAQRLALTGWPLVELEADAIRLTRKGAGLTLNGIAQGYIADRIAAWLSAEGLTDILIDTGEIRALGGQPGGGDWDVTLAGGRGSHRLRDRALATSAPLGTTFDQAGTTGHILDPRSGLPARQGWTQVSVTAPAAALADALSTAFCLMTRQEIDTALAAMPQAGLVNLS
ncbi:FAD:protein FMN transferase [Pannonibacter phragmitetus]|uniref:FAD:protein FMN transferase n=1 Tax=Pannonibacter phragmitetus TaxID=121719 RepID=UPI000F03E784|nr:FAD:protein FMN transferase [Pannonibacter phragmitetus]